MRLTCSLSMHWHCQFFLDFYQRTPDHMVWAPGSYRCNYTLEFLFSKYQDMYAFLWWKFGENIRYALVLIAMYNVWDLIGRYIPLLKFLKLESRKGLVIAILSRFLLVPAFYFTAKYGDQGWMIMLTSFLGLSNGYLTVCVLTSAPKGYKVG